MSRLPKRAKSSCSGEVSVVPSLNAMSDPSPPSKLQTPARATDTDGTRHARGPRREATHFDPCRFYHRSAAKLSPSIDPGHPCHAQHAMQSRFISTLPPSPRADQKNTTRFAKAWPSSRLHLPVPSLGPRARSSSHSSRPWGGSASWTRSTLMPVPPSAVPDPLSPFSSSRLWPMAES
jgi:hypothetical protein